MTDTLLQAAVEVAQLAGTHARSRFGSATLDVELKADGSPVTDADREAERLARAWIERRFPADGIVGEEFGAVRPGAARQWYLDPIDGTKSFVSGVPLWGTLVAVVEDGEAIAGVINCAAADELVAAAPGQGCWWNDQRCRVSDTARLEDAVVLTTDTRFGPTPGRRMGWDRLAGQARVARTWGDAYGYLLVATGRAEAMVDGILNPWDGAALVPILEEAGGVITDYQDRRRAVSDSAIATNRALAGVVRELLIGPKEGAAS